MGEFLDTACLKSLTDHKMVRHINPMKIKYLPEKDFGVDCVPEKMSDGNWDQNLMLLKNGDFYQAANDVFFRSKIWNETKYFGNRLQTTGIICESDRDAYKIKRCKYLNYLFNAMRAFGYVQDPNSDIVGLLIGRNGEIILNNGRHRVALAQLLKIPLIPVTIDVRHTDWVKFCDEVYEYAMQHGGNVYAPIDHIDLSHFSSRQENRVRYIIEAMSPRNQTLVDLGANWGLMCQRLELFGIDCVAVENDPKEIYFLEKLKRAKDSRFEVVQADVVDFITRRHDFDCVLMLSILHHIPAEKRNDLLSKINAKELFFQLPSRDELQVDVSQWIRNILAASCFKHVEQIGPRVDREMFQFTR